jgi:hypothetical protein
MGDRFDTTAKRNQQCVVCDLPLHV